MPDPLSEAEMTLAGHLAWSMITRMPPSVQVEFYRLCLTPNPTPQQLRRMKQLVQEFGERRQ